MADNKSRLAEIYKAEKSKGGGIASTLGKRALEKVDPRKFFNQKGFMATALPSLFKSYSATPAKSDKKVASLGGGSFSTGVLETKLDILTGETRELKIHSKIAAKNSASLPIMARDINLMRQNITKLVKLQGGTAASKADMFFMKAGERETAYETQFTKEGGKSKTPTPVGQKPKEEKKKGIFDYILDFLPTIFKGLLAAGIIGQFLKDPETFKIVKEFATKVLVKFFDGVTASFNLLSDLFDNEDVQKSIRESVSSIFGAIAKFFSIKLTTFSTPFGDVDVTLGGAIAAVVGGFALFKGAMFGTGLAIARLGEAAALAAERIAMGGGGPATTGPAGGKGPNKGPNKGGGKGAALLTLAAMAAPFALSMFNKKPEELTVEEIQAANEAATRKFIEKNGREPTENDLSNVKALEESKANIKGAALTVGAHAVGAVGSAYAVSQSVSGMSAGSKVQGYNTSAKRFTDASGKFVSAKELPKGDMIKKFMDFAVKAQSKGWMGKLYGKLALRLGQSIAIKAAGFIGGLAVPGIGTAVALISLASLAYDAYNIYEAIFGENGILDELEKEDKLQQVSQTPPKAPTDTATPTPAPYNAAKDSQAANPTNTKPTPVSSGNYADRIAGRESGGNYDTIFGSKPGTVATINEKPVSENTIGEVITWQQSEIKKKTNKQAAGKYQFMNVAEAARLAGLGSNELFNGPNQEKMMASYTADNARQLRNEGLPDTEEYLSMAHAVGAKGARKLIDAQNAGLGGETANKILGHTGAAAATNPQLDKSVDSVVASLKGGGPMGHGASGTMLAKNKSDTTLASAPTSSSPKVPSLMPTMPIFGDMLMGATSDLSDTMRMIEGLVNNVTNITNNSTQSSSGGGQQPQGNLPSVYDDIFLNLFQRVT